MKKRQIINIINFIRGYDPRTNDDLTLPVRKQIQLMERYRLPGTFLLQYDALLNPAFSDLLKGLAPTRYELGVWLEMVEPLNHRAGIPWKGRYAWDWQARYGFSVGYTLAERERLIDGLFQGFKEVFGYYPRVMGSWAFDAHTLKYAAEAYGLDAACNCKEQWGTDGYTIWGGPYGQGYYPSRDNVLCPAATAEGQINVPVFRMLGADPVLQYDCGLDVDAPRPVGCQGVCSLEPVYAGEGGGGGEPDWVEWFLKENFSGRCLSFGYAQAGQENSFGWPAMEKGLSYQFARFREWMDRGKFQAETLGETGRWFRRTYPLTPPSVIAADDDWRGRGRKSVWYTCKNYRINLYAEGGRFWVRDLYLFREDYRERYFDQLCQSDKLTFDNLPLADGARWSCGGVRGGLFPAALPHTAFSPTSPDGAAGRAADGRRDSDAACRMEAARAADGLPFSRMVYREETGTARIVFTGTPCGDMCWRLDETGIQIDTDGHHDFQLALRYGPHADGLPEMRRLSPTRLGLTYRGFGYNLQLDKGRIDDGPTLCSHNGELLLRLDQSHES